MSSLWTKPTGDYNDIVDLINEVSTDEENIAILISSMDETEGAATVAQQQIKSLDNSGYDVDVFCFTIQDLEIDNDCNKIGTKYFPPIIRKLNIQFNPFSVLQLLKRIKDYDFCIVHQPNLIIPAIIARYLFKTKLIYINHHVPDPKDLDSKLKEMYNIFIGSNMLRLSARSDYVVSVSKHSRDQFYERFGGNHRVIYNSIDLDNYYPRSNVAEIYRGHEIEGPLVLFVGRLHPLKGIHELIDIVSKLNQSYPNISLLIIGKKTGSSYEELIKKKSKDSNANIEIVGKVEENKLPKYYSAADVYASCSQREGFNLTIAEAESCGTPTIVYDIGAHSEVQTNGRLVQKSDIDKFKKALSEFIEQAR